MEPEQFLHEALGFIAFIVPTALIVIAVIVGLIVGGFIIFGFAVMSEASKDRKKLEQRTAQRIEARNRSNGRWTN